MAGFIASTNQVINERFCKDILLLSRNSFEILYLTIEMSSNSDQAAKRAKISSTEVSKSAQLHSNRKQIAILDFGSQYSHLIARRVRELNVFCELYSCQVHASSLENSHVIGIIFSGGPASVYEEGSPHVDDSVWKFIEKNKIPVLGICYGMQEIAHHFGGQVTPSTEREYGRAMITMAQDHIDTAKLLFENVENMQFWMSHGDKVSKMPIGFVNIAGTSNANNAAIADPINRIFGIQFHPEVTHSIHGKAVLNNFVVKVCEAPTDWNMRDIATEFIKEVR